MATHCEIDNQGSTPAIPIKGVTVSYSNDECEYIKVGHVTRQNSTPMAKVKQQEDIQAMSETRRDRGWYHTVNQPVTMGTEESRLHKRHSDFGSYCYPVNDPGNYVVDKLKDVAHSSGIEHCEIDGKPIRSPCQHPSSRENSLSLSSQTRPKSIEPGSNFGDMVGSDGNAHHDSSRHNDMLNYANDASVYEELPEVDSPVEQTPIQFDFQRLQNDLTNLFKQLQELSKPDTSKYILEKLESIENRLTKLENRESGSARRSSKSTSGMREQITEMQRTIRAQKKPRYSRMDARLAFTSKGCFDNKTLMKIAQQIGHEQFPLSVFLDVPNEEYSRLQKTHPHDPLHVSYEILKFWRDANKQGDAAKLEELIFAFQEAGKDMRHVLTDLIKQQ